MRPPCASIDSRAGEFRNDGALLVEFGLHSARHAFGLELGLILRADEWILHPVRDGGAPLGDVHGRVVGMLLARRARLAPGIMRPEPGSEPERVFRGAE